MANQAGGERGLSAPFTAGGERGLQAPPFAAAGLFVLGLLLALPAPARAHLLPRPLKLLRVNLHLAGTVLDYTRNHGADHRIWSPALEGKRDLYVYLPPGYDPCKHYPLAIYLHGFISDELSFLSDVVK